MSAPIPPYDPTRQMLVTPDDPDAPARMERLRRIGVGNAPLEEFDGIARELAHALGAPYAMVNFIDTENQYFAGLFMPANGQAGMELGPEQAATDPRVMARDHGWCPNVVVRRKALVLPDVYAYRKFGSNPVINELGIRAYIGAPLIDWQSGIALGTVCAIAPEIIPWGREGLETIKGFAQRTVGRLHEIEERGRF